MSGREECRAQSVAQDLALHKTMTDGVCSVEEVVQTLKSIQPFGSEGSASRETAHEWADLFLLEALKLLGQHELVEAYNRVKKDHDGFWFA